MTIRRLWLVVLVFVSVLVVGINAIILTTLTDKYFTEFLKESYAIHIEQILDYTKTALSEDEVSNKQMAIELETHLIDPIIHIKVYNKEGDLLVDVEDDNYISGNMMGDMMSDRMMQSGTSNEVNQYEITDGSGTIGILNVTLHNLAENSFVARKFKGSLLINSFYAVLIAIFIAFIIGILISKKMSRSLQETAKIASDIQMGEVFVVKPTYIKEVNTIRESLEELNSRLKLKQKSRKALVDQLIHQTRTPLTILKSHIEAIEDGIVMANTEELTICQNQVENITSIIANMSGMIDANKEFDEVRVETFEFNHMVKLILAGLKSQFLKKSIDIKLVSNDPVNLTTDKYKLSQSIYNILINAYKYTKEGGTVRVSYIQTENRLSIKIQDSGIGISEKESSKIFNAYYRGDRAIDVSGDGIGLFIVRENLRLIDGSIKVESKLNIGSTFTLEIPMQLEK
jgi:signal transduction histidine kinase